MKLGNLIDTAGLTKSNLKEAVKLGLGAGAFPFVYGLIQSKLLLRASATTFAQGTPAEYATRALAGVMLGALTNRLAKMPAVGDGMVASAVGSVVRDLVAPMFNPAAAASQAAVTAAEKSGIDQMSGINPLGRGLAGLGNLAGLSANPAMLFGVGTPDTSAGRMFSGATVAIQENNGFHGATVAIEPSNNFAGAFTH